MNTPFLSSWRWRLVGWVTALIFSVLFIYAAVQVYQVVLGGGA